MNSNSFHLTTKQKQLMETIAAGDGEGGPIDLDQLLERIPYDTTKQSLQFSIRALEGHGLILRDEELVRRRDRFRRTVSMTDKGKEYVFGAKSESFVTDVGDSDDERSFVAEA